jgi:hypothetical protein
MLIVFATALSLVLPAGWRVAHPVLLEPCRNPVPRLAVAKGRSLVLIEESLDGSKYLARFPARPRHFRVRGRPSLMGCCAAAKAGSGWELFFRQGGRGVYAFVYGDPHQALPVLDSLSVGHS